MAVTRKYRLAALLLCLLLALTGCGAGTAVSLTEQESRMQAQRELENKLTAQKAYVIAASRTDQVLEDDLLTAAVQNASDADIATLYLAFAAWDAAGRPVVLKSASGDTTDGYIKLCVFKEVSLAAGERWEGDCGMAVTDSGHIRRVKAVVVAYETADGTYWENPCYAAWCATYGGITLY